MSIKTTQDISRDIAINRIRTVASLISDRNFRRLEDITFEGDNDIREFIDKGVTFNVDELENWTNNMLGDQMDEPFYRHSKFDNYLINNEV